MKISLVLIFVVSVIGALSGIYWKVDNDFVKDKLRWNEAQSRAQISAFSHSIATELESLTQILDMAYPLLSVSKHDYSVEQVFSRFHMIAKVSKQSTGELGVENKYFLENSPVKNWGEHYTTLALKGLNLDQARTGVLLSLQDPQQKTWFLFAVTSKISQMSFAAIISADFLQPLIDRQKGQLSTVAVVNAKAQVIGHGISDYVGKNLGEDEMVKELVAHALPSGMGYYTGIDGERAQGFYEMIEGTNLYIMISTSFSTLMAERSGIRRHFIFLGFGVIFIGLAFLMLIEQPKRAQATQQAVTQRPELKQNPPPAPKPAAPAVENSIAQVNAAPPKPLPKADRTQANDKFEELFSPNKIEQAYDMIDNLETPHQSAELATEAPPVEDYTEVAKQIEAEIDPPMVHKLEEPATVDEEEAQPLVKIVKRERKMDSFRVAIRKPGER